MLPGSKASGSIYLSCLQEDFKPKARKLINYQPFFRSEKRELQRPLKLGARCLKDFNFLLMKTTLKHDYIKILNNSGSASFYGGSQLFLDGDLRRCGCSLIAAADVLLYIGGFSRPKPVCRSVSRPISKSVSRSVNKPVNRPISKTTNGSISRPIIKTINRPISTMAIRPVRLDHYRQLIYKLAPAFPLVPGRGIPGMVLALYLKFYLAVRRLPFKARAGRLLPLKDALSEAITASLQDDLPVILFIGPGIHQSLKAKDSRGIMLYRRDNKTGELTPVKRVRSHFVVITAIDETYITVSSWGAEYLINIAELQRYVPMDLGGIFSNIITLHRT